MTRATVGNKTALGTFLKRRLNSREKKNKPVSEVKIAKGINAHSISFQTRLGTINASVVNSIHTAAQIAIIAKEFALVTLRRDRKTRTALITLTNEEKIISTM